MDTTDPYAYGAQWRLKGDPEVTARILGVVEDPGGHVPGGLPGGAYVVITGDDRIPTYTPSVESFVTLFERPDGTVPRPSIPAQRTGE